MLNGKHSETQPVSGELMCDYRRRLADELCLPSKCLSLVAGEALLPLDACLDEFPGSIQLIIHRLHLREEFRVEASKTLLLHAMPDLLATDMGKDLLSRVLSHWHAIEPGGWLQFAGI